MCVFALLLRNSDVSVHPSVLPPSNSQVVVLSHALSHWCTGLSRAIVQTKGIIIISNSRLVSSSTFLLKILASRCPPLLALSSMSASTSCLSRPVLPRRQWRVVGWVGILLDVISEVQSVFWEGCYPASRINIGAEMWSELSIMTGVYERWCLSTLHIRWGLCDRLCLVLVCRGRYGLVVWGVGQERLGPSYFFISLVLGSLNSLVWYVPSLRYTRGLGWRMHCGVEVTKSSTNKQHHLSLMLLFPISVISSALLFYLVTFSSYQLLQKHPTGENRDQLLQPTLCEVHTHSWNPPFYPSVCQSDDRWTYERLPSDKNPRTTNTQKKTWSKACNIIMLS